MNDGSGVEGPRSSLTGGTADPGIEPALCLLGLVLPVDRARRLTPRALDRMEITVYLL